ncbi:hypothetical protein [Sinomonas mesophila]|uniref:hypothetical protein n=1 Tax=Sinomonas mesophila TaxID=1531955 RepID=UPI00098769EF|nr:hypothetical protein [Sinomonas mesophila]
MDDALLVANLVYLGTLVIGGVLFLCFSMAFVIVLFLAGAGQGVASLLGIVLRPFQRLFARGQAQERTTAAPAGADSVRAAVVAKADAILASHSAATYASAAQSREAQSPAGRLRPEPADVPAPAPTPAALPAAAPRLAITGKSTGAVVRPHTGTQPILVVKAS